MIFLNPPKSRVTTPPAEELGLQKRFTQALVPRCGFSKQPTYSFWGSLPSKIMARRATLDLQDGPDGPGRKKGGPQLLLGEKGEKKTVTPFIIPIPSMYGIFTYIWLF